MTPDEQWVDLSAEIKPGHMRIEMPKSRSTLHASPYLALSGPQPMPNRWRRFWYWALLGWWWEEIR